MAVTRAIQIEELRVFGRDERRRERFAGLVAEDWGRSPVVAASAEQALTGADVVITITTSAEPVFKAAWVRQGALVCGCGSNIPTRSEIPPELVSGADVIVADQVEAAQIESGDLLKAGVDWSRVVGLGEVLAGKAPGRQSDDQTGSRSGTSPRARGCWPRLASAASEPRFPCSPSGRDGPGRAGRPGSRCGARS